MSNKCVWCDFIFALDDKGYNDMFSVLDHITEIHPDWFEKAQEAKANKVK